jgi:hypothetical protein
MSRNLTVFPWNVGTASPYISVISLPGWRLIILTCCRSTRTFLVIGDRKQLPPIDQRPAHAYAAAGHPEIVSRAFLWKGKPT